MRRLVWESSGMDLVDRILVSLRIIEINLGMQADGVVVLLLRVTHHVLLRVYLLTRSTLHLLGRKEIFAKVFERVLIGIRPRFGCTHLNWVVRAGL